MPHQSEQANLRIAHQHASNHRAELHNSSACGCFYCCATFTVAAVVEWVDPDENGVGQSAICPYCGVDSVIGSASGFAIQADFLNMMHRYWF